MVEFAQFQYEHLRCVSNTLTVTWQLCEEFDKSTGGRVW